MVEVLCALLLIRTTTRTLGRWCTATLLFAFTLFVATHAADSAFIRDCGCFGALAAIGSSDHESTLNWMLGRNSILFALVSFGLWQRPLPANRINVPGFRTSPAWLTVVVALWLTAKWQSEHAMRDYQRDFMFAADRGNHHARTLGWELPDLDLRDTSGSPVAMNEVLHQGDQLILFSPTCEHCLQMRPAWQRHAMHLAERGQRLVLLIVSDADQLNNFGEGFALDTIPTFEIRDRLAYAELGVVKIPSLLILGENRRVVFNNTLNWQPPGVQSNVEQRLVLRGGPNPAYSIQVEITLDQDGKIQTIRPLQVGDYARHVWPGQPGLQVLVGKTMAQAFTIAQQMSAQAVMEAPVWAALTDAFPIVP